MTSARKIMLTAFRFKPDSSGYTGNFLIRFPRRRVGATAEDCPESFFLLAKSSDITTNSRNAILMLRFTFLPHFVEEKGRDWTNKQIDDCHC